MGVVFYSQLTLCVCVWDPGRTSTSFPAQRAGGMQEAQEDWHTAVLSSKGSRAKMRLLVWLFGSIKPAFNWGPWEGYLCQTCGNAKVHLTRRPSMECSAPWTLSHYSMFGAQLCVISVGLASLDLLLCVCSCVLAQDTIGKSQLTT